MIVMEYVDTRMPDVFRLLPDIDGYRLLIGEQGENSMVLIEELLSALGRDNARHHRAVDTFLRHVHLRSTTDVASSNTRNLPAHWSRYGASLRRTVVLGSDLRTAPHWETVFGGCHSCHTVNYRGQGHHYAYGRGGVVQ